VRAGKKKREREDAGRRGERDGGLLGHLGRKGGRRWFSFFSFSFSFSNFIFKPIFISNSNQTFQTFSQEFYKLFLKTTQATKNHASQLMMHIHLLSLSLLNYI
jgi:hypothetical protein